MLQVAAVKGGTFITFRPSMCVLQVQSPVVTQFDSLVSSYLCLLLKKKNSYDSWNLTFDHHTYLLFIPRANHLDLPPLPIRG